MIKLLIQNKFQEDLTEECLNFLKEEAENTHHGKPWNPFYLKDYDKDKWKHGRIYEFNNLKELKEFTDAASDEIEYTDEHYDSFNDWSWQGIDFDLDIDTSEDNLMVLYIDAVDEWRD